ncbi:MAG: DUF5302 domain-containing protein [Nocardioidaceae bacterium]
MNDKNPKADEAKRRFREALDKKHQHHHATAEGAVHDGSKKSHGSTGPIEKPVFQRKTGGGGA